MVTRVILVDDHKMIREGLEAMLSADPGLEVIGTADNGRDAVRLVTELHPDIVVMDIAMPDLNGVEATRQIVQRCGATRVIALSVHKDRRFVSAMLEAGAAGYVLKDSSFDELATAVRTVAAGRCYLSPECTGVVIDDYREQLTRDPASADAREDDRAPQLTPREREVLQLLAEGHSTKEIAARLYLSPKTVETHRRQIMEKLDIHNVPGLVKYALREGLASLDD